MALQILGEAKTTVKGSRFFALFARVDDEAQIKGLLAGRGRTVKKACHHCWGARIRDPGGRIMELARDDGEVGRPGYRILELLRAHELEGVIIVSRVFGGVKLGPAGVGRAFREAAQAVISGASVTGPS